MVRGDGFANPFHPSVCDWIEKLKLNVQVSVAYDPLRKNCIVRVSSRKPIKFPETVKLLRLDDWVGLCEKKYWCHRWLDQPIYPASGDPAETRYMRSDQQTVNGLTAYILGTARSESSTYKEISESGEYDVRWRVYVYVRHADGSTDSIASGYVYRDADGEGLQTLNLDIPQTSLVSTDAVEVVVRILIYSVDTYIYFITEQLGASQLDAATWTFYLYTYRDYHPIDDITYARFYFGSSDYDSRIQNFSWTPAPPVVAKRIIGDGLTWIVT